MNFSNVQNITTGAGSDNTFVFKPGGSLAGTLTGDPENADTILVELQAGPISKSVTFTAITDTSNGSITVDSATVVSYVGIRNPSNLQVLTTSSADVMNLRRTAANTVTLKSTNTTFADVTIVGLSDSLTIRAGLGNDELTVDPQIFGADTGFIFDGQDGTDSLVMAAGTSVTGLTDGSSYVVIPHLTDPKKLQLALASSPTTPIDLTAAGLGAEHYLLLGSAKSFIVPPIGFTDDTLVFATAHGFTTGQAVIYDNGGNRSIGPLVSGTVYYAVVLSATTLQLALTSEYALRATPDTIKLTDSGLSLPSTTHTLQAALVFDPLLGVDLASNTITFATNHGITLTPPVSVRYRAGAKFDFAMYVASSDNSGLVSRDDMGVQYIRVESVEDRSVANERVVRLPHANNIAQVTKVGSQIQVTSPADDFVDFKLEEPINYLGLELLGGSNTVIVDMFTPVGALGFEINGRPAGIADTPDVGGLTAINRLEVRTTAGAAAQTFVFSKVAGDAASGSFTLNGTKFLSYIGIEDAPHLLVNGTTGADNITITTSAGAASIAVATLGTIAATMAGGTLTIDGGAGADTFTLASGVSYASPLTLLGGTQTDTLTIAGTYSNLTYGGFETVTDTATVATRTFLGTDLADTITLRKGTGNKLELVLGATTIAFEEPTSRLRILAGGGLDVLTIDLDDRAGGSNNDLTAVLELNGGDGDDT
ncbi:MAG: hypothetical protein ACAH88_20570, partial [Roseimicrobium sp.]